MRGETANVIAGDRPDFSSDFALIAALKNKEAAAAEALVRRFGSRSLATAQQLLNSEADAADAVQEGFLSAIEGIETFKGKSTIGTWLHRIVVNACLMKLRERARRSERSINGLLPTFDRSGHHTQAVRVWAAPPDEELLRDEARALVRRSIDLLPDDHRTVLLLRDIEQFSTQEAADILGETPGTIKTRLHRARQALRTLLEPHFISPPDFEAG
jgi:RNA polymerase sigma-70 factor, ECF subfamily